MSTDYSIKHPGVPKLLENLDQFLETIKDDKDTLVSREMQPLAQSEGEAEEAVDVDQVRGGETVNVHTVIACNVSCNGF